MRYTNIELNKSLKEIRIDINQGGELPLDGMFDLLYTMETYGTKHQKKGAKELRKNGFNNTGIFSV